MTKYEKIISQLLLLIGETNIELLICQLGRDGKLAEYKDTILQQKEYLLALAREIQNDL